MRLGPRGEDDDELRVGSESLTRPMGRASANRSDAATGHDDALARDDLYNFLARMLGWSNARLVDLALRAVDLATQHQAALVLCGAGDLVPVAHALHRRTLGADRPFVVCDPRRGDAPASVRSPVCYGTGASAVPASAGGTLCVRTRRPPPDLVDTVTLLRGVDDVMLVVCVDPGDDANLFLARPGPVRLPALADRADELPRVIDEYLRDATAELGVPEMVIADEDRAWVRKHAASSLAEVEKAALRLVAVRSSSSTTAAAERLGMTSVSLIRWARRRKMPLLIRRRR
jgi:hypothetical protein